MYLHRKTAAGSHSDILTSRPRLWQQTCCHRKLSQFLTWVASESLVLVVLLSLIFFLLRYSLLVFSRTRRGLIGHFPQTQTFAVSKIWTCVVRSHLISFQTPLISWRRIWCHEKLLLLFKFSQQPISFACSLWFSFALPRFLLFFLRISEAVCRKVLWGTNFCSQVDSRFYGPIWFWVRCLNHAAITAKQKKSVPVINCCCFCFDSRATSCLRWFFFFQNT